MGGFRKKVRNFFGRRRKSKKSSPRRSPNPSIRGSTPDLKSVDQKPKKVLSLTDLNFGEGSDIPQEGIASEAVKRERQRRQRQKNRRTTVGQRKIDEIGLSNGILSKTPSPTKEDNEGQTQKAACADFSHETPVERISIKLSPKSRTATRDTRNKIKDKLKSKDDDLPGLKVKLKPKDDELPGIKGNAEEKFCSFIIPFHDVEGGCCSMGHTTSKVPAEESSESRTPTPRKVKWRKQVVVPLFKPTYSAESVRKAKVREIIKKVMLTDPGPEHEEAVDSLIDNEYQSLLEDLRNGSLERNLQQNKFPAIMPEDTKNENSSVFIGLHNLHVKAKPLNWDEVTVGGCRATVRRINIPDVPRPETEEVERIPEEKKQSQSRRAPTPKQDVLNWDEVAVGEHWRKAGYEVKESKTSKQQPTGVVNWDDVPVRGGVQYNIPKTSHDDKPVGSFNAFHLETRESSVTQNVGQPAGKILSALSPRRRTGSKDPQEEESFEDLLAAIDKEIEAENKLKEKEQNEAKMNKSKVTLKDSQRNASPQKGVQVDQNKQRKGQGVRFRCPTPAGRNQLSEVKGLPCLRTPTPFSQSPQFTDYRSSDDEMLDEDECRQRKRMKDIRNFRIANSRDAIYKKLAEKEIARSTPDEHKRDMAEIDRMLQEQDRLGRLPDINQSAIGRCDINQSANGRCDRKVPTGFTDDLDEIPGNV